MRSWMWLVPLSACVQDLALKAIPNEPPTAEIATHGDGDVVREAYLETIRGLVDDDQPDEELEVRWFVDAEEVCNEPADDRGDVVCDFEVPRTDAILVPRGGRGGLRRA